LCCQNQQQTTTVVGTTKVEVCLVVSVAGALAVAEESCCSCGVLSADAVEKLRVLTSCFS
jgi:hypothetical protein